MSLARDDFHEDLNDPTARQIIRLPRPPFPWVGMILIVLGLLVAIFAAGSMCGCAVPATVPAFSDAPPQAQSTAGIDEYCVWSDRKMQELSERFAVEVPSVMFIDEPCPPIGEVVLFGLHLCSVYMVGEYDIQSVTVFVWLRDPRGKRFTDRFVQETVAHEWLHHLDARRGLPPPPGDHNDLFDRRIAAMGLLE